MPAIVTRYYAATEFTLVLVDLENYPHIGGEFLTTHFENVHMAGFVGKCSALAQVDLHARYPFMHVEVVNSVLPDAVDHYISLYAGMYMSYGVHLIILTRDRFAGCLVDAVKQRYGGVDAIHVTNSTQCFDELVKHCIGEDEWKIY